MASKDCIKAIKASAKEGVITDAEAKQIIADINRLAKEKAAKKMLSMEKATAEAADELATREQILAKADRRAELFDLQARRRFKDFSKRFPIWGKGVTADTFGAETTATKGAGFGADQQMLGLRGRFLSRLFAEMEQAGVLEDFNKGRFGEEFYIESHQLDTPDGKPGITKNKTAQEVARIYRDIQDQANAMINQRGGYRGNIPGWIITQTHSQEALFTAGGGDMGRSLLAWKADVLAGIDAERTFQGADPELWLRDFHKNIYTGHHGTPLDSAEVSSKPKRYGSIAKRVSSERKLFFKGPKEAFAYNEKWGVRDYKHAIIENLNRDARAIVLMERYGPNAKANYIRGIEELREEAKHRPDSKKQLDALNVDQFISKYEVLSGEINVSSRPTLSRWMDNIKGVKVAAVSGKMMLSAIVDKAFIHSEMTYQGARQLDSLMQNVQGQLIGVKASREKLLAHAIVPHAYIGNISSKWGVEFRTEGMVKGMVNKAFSLNALNWITDISKATMADSTAIRIGDHADLPMDALPMEMGRLLQHYGITGKEWDAMRSTKYTVDGDPYEGFKFLTVDQFKNIKDDMLDSIVAERGLTENASNRKRILQSIQDKYQSLLVDRMMHGVPEPGAKEKYFTSWGGQHRGTFAGEIASLVAIFKSFPITVANKVMGRDLYGTGAKTFLQGVNQGKWRIAQLIAMTTVLGATANAARDILNGRTPRRMVESNGDINWDVFMAAMQRGGGAGIYSDFLFSEYDSQWRHASQNLLGPVLGQVDPLFAMASKARGAAMGNEGVRAESLLYDAEKFAEGNIPFASLFYVKPVLDYFIFWNLKEMASPGVLKRTERSVKDKNHQDFWVTPSEDRFEF
jgi:hypothetical protein